MKWAVIFKCYLYLKIYNSNQFPTQQTEHCKGIYVCFFLSAILTIIIEDENDNNPKFRRPFYRRSITENSKNGVTIVNIVADDADKNRAITYSLEGMFCNTVFINNYHHPP